MAVAILIGIPASIRAQVERYAGHRVEIRVIPMKQDGGFRLELPPHHAAVLLDQYAGAAPAYEDVHVLVLPYAQIPDEVTSLANLLGEMGARVLRPQPNSQLAGLAQKWPSRSPRLDTRFREELLRAIAELFDREFPAPEVAENREIACALIRGLAVHSKMGPNNHSHEDDLWKACHANLAPGGRQAIVDELMAAGILARKRNDSAGGKGWVYWIAAVERAKAFCPDLEPYFR